ncbi:MAG TPA: FAD-containing oxidoreductase [Geminicoccaceae bacterium]|nr:FAD-containing oxidoreductase [Geminicoccaceae bacterium]
MAISFDAIVIGTGQSGPSLAHRLAGAGRRVAIAERKRFGGTCVNNGCIPTKSLIASARAAHVARRAGDFGVRIDGAIRVDMRAVKARKDAIVKVSNEGVEEGLREAEGITVFTEHARFVGPKQVAVGDEVLTAEHIFLNVGGRAAIPPIPGIDQGPWLDNSSMMAVDFLPAHLVILGGSYIGLEFGQMYRRFGSEVTIIQRNERLIPREDPDISQATREILEDEGIRILTDAAATRIAHRSGEVAVSVSAGDATTEVVGSHLLVATGRRPNTDDLGLEAAGIETDAHGYIKVDGALRTNVPGVFAMGDCNGRGAFTHTSYNDFEIVAANLLDGAARRVEDRILTYALFVDPPLGRAGMTETEVRRKGIKALVAKMPMEDVGRAYERSETKGFMKIIVEAGSKQILGAALLGIEGDEIVQGLLDMMYAKAPFTVIQRAMHIHPTVYEMIPYMELEPLA